jgi:hypothetical protein
LSFHTFKKNSPHLTLCSCYLLWYVTLCFVILLFIC